jgi:hypothetical protein
MTKGDRVIANSRYTASVIEARDLAAVDAQALASRIGRALALDSAERAAIGARAREHVGANFTLAQMQGSTLAVYDEVLGTDLAERFKRAHQQSLAPVVQTTGETTPFQHSVYEASVTTSGGRKRLGSTSLRQ